MCLTDKIRSSSSFLTICAPNTYVLKLFVHQSQRKWKVGFVLTPAIIFTPNSRLNLSWIPCLAPLAHFESRWSAVHHHRSQNSFQLKCVCLRPAGEWRVMKPSALQLKEKQVLQQMGSIWSFITSCAIKVQACGPRVLISVSISVLF